MPDGREIVVSVQRIASSQAWLGFDAPADVRVDRREVAIKRKAARQRGTDETL
jgi:sRNA-binding carbon storage regulator CsrA